MFVLNTVFIVKNRFRYKYFHVEDSNPLCLSHKYRHLKFGTLSISCISINTSAFRIPFANRPSSPDSDSDPIKIRRPIELSGKTLEWRLLNYDWKNQFEYFQAATHTGTINPMCWRRGESLLPVSACLLAGYICLFAVAIVR